jgi:prepilin-type N-terminal cleavage/methylation domain-containing protein
MRARAFTLIEVLLAVAIFSIVLVAIHMVFYAAVQLRNKSMDAIQEQIPFQQTLAVIKRDLANIVMPGGTNATFFGAFQTTQTSTSLSNALNSLNPVNDAMPGQSGPPFFTTTGILQDTLPWGDVLRVAYFLAPPTNNTRGKDLIRSVTRNLLPTVTDQPERQVLMSGLQSIEFFFYDGMQWRNYWDSTVETNILPFGFKVQLQLVPEPTDRSPRPPIELVVPLMLQASTNQINQVTGGTG